MKRSGGKAGRPFAQLSINDLETFVGDHKNDDDELTVVLSELGFRRSKRSKELKQLVIRLIDKSKLGKAADIGPLFEHPSDKE